MATADDDARYQQKLAARAAGTATTQTYPSNRKPIPEADVTDAVTAQYHAKLAARAKAEADAKAAAAAAAQAEAPVEAESAAEAKAEAPAPKAEAEVRDQGRRR